MAVVYSARSLAENPTGHEVERLRNSSQPFAAAP